MEAAYLAKLESVFGKMPKRPEHLRVLPISEDRTLCGGRAVRKEFHLICEVGERSVAFPAVGYFPKTEAPFPILICLSDEKDDRDLPLYRILGAGFGVITFSVLDVTENDGNFRNRVASLFSIHRRAAEATGKLAIWAWAVSRIIDALQVLCTADSARIFAVGDRLCGRAALLAAAFDGRISGIMASGIGLSVPSVSQHDENAAFFGLTELYPHLYSPKFASASYADEMPFAEQIGFASLQNDRLFLLTTAEFDREIPHRNEAKVIGEEVGICAVGEAVRSDGLSFSILHGGARNPGEAFDFYLSEVAFRLPDKKTAKN